MNNITSVQLQSYKRKNQKIVVLTAYDATMASLIDPHVDVVLVGDSLGMVFQGHSSTLKVTLDDMIYHSAAVAKVCTHAHLVADMPFMTTQISEEEALRGAARLVQDGSVQSVKIEGGRNHAQTVKRVVGAGVPVMGHVGLTPQSVHSLGGFRLQGVGRAAEEALMADARALEDAGAYAIVLELVPADVSTRITESLSIPTIGIGAGAGCDGQVLVSTDLLGLNPQFRPKFVKRYADLAAQIEQAISEYADEVRTGAFPALEHSFQDPPPATTK